MDEIPDIGDGPADERLRRFVDARVCLHDKVAPIARMARVQANLGGPIAAQLQVLRASRAGHGRSSREIRRIWTTAVDALLSR